jgi:hypothetical protein
MKIPMHQNASHIYVGEGERFGVACAEGSCARRRMAVAVGEEADVEAAPEKTGIERRR